MIHQTTGDEKKNAFEEAAVEALRKSLRGKLLREGEDGYDQARAVWNGMINRRPALIVRCAGVTDVIAAVNFARTYHQPVAVKCGGHNFAGLSVCEGGVMIDLSQMRDVEVDVTNRTARVGGGALLSDLDRETQAFGLATTAGTVSHTGIGGLTLGGGQGWLMNQYGLTCDNLLAVDLVTAEGRLLTASPTQYEDLFWAVRGGGGNFGIVTSFTYRLHLVGPVVPGGMVLYPVEQAKQVLQFYREHSVRTPDAFSMLAGILCLPDGTPAIALAAAWFGAASEGEAYLKPLRELGTPLADLLGELPYTQLQTLFDAAVPYGMPRYGKMGYLPELSDELIDLVLINWHNRTSPYSLVLFNAIKGAVTRVAPTATPFVHRQRQWHFDILAQWTDPAGEANHIAWARALWQETVSFTRGTSINFLAADDGQDRVKLSFGVNYDRLAQIKAEYDPDNFFRMNTNILPRPAEATAEK